jgi:dTDP-4-dehydrorhamnose 3,5-epimerase
MEFITTDIKNVFQIKPKVFRDQRGFFLESYSTEIFARHGIEAPFVQDNHSKSEHKNVLRGLHFQLPPFDQSKLIRVTKGSIFDCIIDLRSGSETYGQWRGFVLSEENFMMIYVPRGFAHGFCTLTDATEVHYKVDRPYRPEYDSGIRWNDPDLAVEWPCENPVVSEKDAGLPLFKEFKSPFSL